MCRDDRIAVSVELVEAIMRSFLQTVALVAPYGACCRDANEAVLSSAERAFVTCRPALTGPAAPTA